MKCIDMFGHSWSAWSRSFGIPRKIEDHEGLWRQELMRRTCDKCNYVQHEWTPMFRQLTEAATEQEGT